MTESVQYVHRSNKIRTLSDIGQSNDSDDEEHENLYAGGEKSYVDKRWEENEKEEKGTKREFFFIVAW